MCDKSYLAISLMSIESMSWCGTFQLPDVTFALHNITVLMESNIVSEVSQGRDSFLKIQKDIQHAVNQTIPVVSASIRRSCNFLASIANNMTALIDRINVDIDKVYMRHLEVARSNINQYSPYRFVTNKSELNALRDIEFIGDL